MAKTVAPPATVRDWVAQDVDELCRVWKDLHPESDDDETERRFFGRMLSPEDAGNVFERWMTETFRLSGACGQPSFTVPMAESGMTREQFDGLIVDGITYLLESKFWPGKVDFAPISHLHTLIGMRPLTTMGLFFSPFGFTRPAEESVRYFRPIRVLLFISDDLQWALPPADMRKQKATNHFADRMLNMVRRKRFLAERDSTPLGFIDQAIDLFNEGA